MSKNHGAATMSPRKKLAPGYVLALASVIRRYDDAGFATVQEVAQDCCIKPIVLRRKLVILTDRGLVAHNTGTRPVEWWPTAKGRQAAAEHANRNETVTP